MATITIKLDTEDLARDVLEYLGYLPEDSDLPDLVDEDEEWVPPPKPVIKKSTKFVD